MITSGSLLLAPFFHCPGGGESMFLEKVLRTLRFLRLWNGMAAGAVGQ